MTYVGRWRWIRPRWEVVTTFGLEDERGIPGGGAAVGGFFLTETMARRAYARERFRPGRKVPQIAYLLRWDGTTKTTVERRLLK